MNTVNFGTDDYGVEESALARRLQLAQLMTQQGMDGAPVFSNKAGIAKALLTALGGYERGQAEKSQRELADRKDQGRKAEVEAIFREVEGAAPGIKPLTANDDEGNPMPSTPGAPGQRMTLARLLAGSSNPAMAQAGLSMAMRGPEKPEAFTLKPGERRFVGDRVVAEVPDAIKPEGPKKGEIRKLDMGGDLVTQEWDGSGWKEVAKAPRWQPQQADRTVMEVQDPRDPNRTIIVSRDEALRKGMAGAQSVTGARQSREDVDGLRKEFTALPAVKTFNEVRPIIESARKAPDTPQGDFALIYGVGKVLDPNSVVREGEMNMVIASGSPAQRVEGYLAQLKGKGRITPSMRKELVTILDQRSGEYEKQYQAARSTYEGIAKQRGHDSTQIFTQPPGMGGGPKPGDVVDGYRYKGGPLNDPKSWERG